MKRVMQSWWVLVLALGMMSCGEGAPSGEGMPRASTEPAGPPRAQASTEALLETPPAPAAPGSGASTGSTTASSALSDRGGEQASNAEPSRPVTGRDDRPRAGERPESIAAPKDEAPPVLSLRVPGAGPEVVTHSPYVLRGLVGDDSGRVRVSVQGIEVPVLAGGFLATVPLTAGDNAVVVRAWDEAGNQTQRMHVLRVASLPPQVTILSPLSGSESPGAQATVRVRVTSATSSVQKVWVSEREASQKRPGEYEATYALKLGDNTIEVRAVDAAGLSSTSSVRLNYRSIATAPLVVTGVSPLHGAAGVEPDSLVSVAFNKPVKWDSLKEHFLVKLDGTPLKGGYSLAPGGQTAMFVADQALPERARLTVSVEGVLPEEGSPMEAGFSSDFTVRGPLTRVRGNVTDADLRPLSGVGVTLEGRNLSTRTGPDGNWALFLPEGGEVVVRYEGGVDADGRSFPKVRRRLFIAPGEETVDAPLMLTPTDTASAQWVQVAEGTDLTFAGRQPGLRVTREGSALTFEDGKTAAFMTATWLPSHSLPVPVEGRAALGGLWQLAPAGMRLSAPVTFSLPNLTPGLPEGRYALLLAYDPRRHVLARVGFGRVHGATIVTEAPLRLESLEFLAYMPLTQEQHDAVAHALGTDVSPDGGVEGEDGGSSTDGGSPTDGGLGWLRRAPRSPKQPWWKLPLSPLLVGEAHAQVLGALFTPGISALDAQMANSVPGAVMGTVRAPMDQEIAFTLLEPASLRLGASQHWDTPPYTLPVKFKVNHIQRAADDTRRGQVQAKLEVSDSSGPLAPPPGERWSVEGEQEALVATQLTFAAGVTKLKMMGSSPAGMRVLEVTATLTRDDGGAGATLTLTREPGSTALEDELQTPIRFKGLRVTVTGPAGGGAGVTGDRGTYGIPVLVPGGDEMGISCTEVPLAPKLVERTGEDGLPRFDPVMQQFGVCSETYSVSAGRSTTADILVDARFFHGGLLFVDRAGQPLEPSCEETEAASELDPERPGEYLSISPKDVKGTEVHFFREDDLEHPISSYSLAVADPRICTGPPPTDGGESSLGHGAFTQLRLGPTHGIKRYARKRCLELEQGGGPQTQEEKDYYAANCQDNRTNFMSLSAGDRVVVFAINHATGYAGMKTVTVPPINSSTRNPDDGSCAADENQPPLTVSEYGQNYELSRCTLQQLSIPVGSIQMFPPEIDLRVSRQMETQGSQKQKLESLVRQGGAATTSDDLIAVSTHWRVRVKPYVSPDGGTEVDGGGDGGSSASCDAGPCPGALVDQGDAGLPLEVYCSELPPTASASARKACVNQEPPLLDVPSGVPPMAGRLLKVTGSAQEQPMVKIFPVKSGGRFTQSVQLAERYQTPSGELKPLNALPRANYYVHTVGYSVFDRDTNQDGFIQKNEENKAPPNFSAAEAPTEGPEAGRIPTHAVGLKNIYRHIEPDGNKLEHFDLAREHAFRVIQIEDSQIIVQGRSPDDAGTDLTKAPAPAATQYDTSYDFLLHLLEPDRVRQDDARNEEYVVRLGGDGFGIDCPIEPRPEEDTLVLSGSCGGDFLPDILTSDDLLYLELYLRGNAENVLYRFNFEGLSARTDFLSAGHAYTLRQAEAPELVGGEAAPGREISQAPMANFSIKESEFTRGLVTLYARKPGASDVEVKRASIILDKGAWKLEQVAALAGDPNVHVPLSYDPQPANGTWNFHVPLPSSLAAMEGGTQNTQTSIWVKMEALEPRGGLMREYKLGKPVGTFVGVNAAARAQDAVAGVNVADGHLSFTHTDFSVPDGTGSVGFSRTYNNQNNLLTPMGLGWSHNYDGWVLEEKYLERYVVVLGGQAYPFPRCVPDALAGMPERVRCSADTSHNNVLYVNAPLPELSSSNMSSLPLIEMRTPQGGLFRFTQPAQREDRPGRRKWLLKMFGELRKEPGLGPVAEVGSGNWGYLDYEEGSNLVSEVSWTPGNTKLVFAYEGIDNEKAPTRVRVLARSRGFKWLSKVELQHKPTSNRVLYRVDFEREPNGNLLHAARTQWVAGEGSEPKGPFPLWTYAYHSIPSGLAGEERWEASNELSKARLIHSATVVELAASGSAPTSPVQWWADYARATDSSSAGRYKHSRFYELVSRVDMTGQQQQPLTLAYPDPKNRVVTRPDGISTHLTLNEYGSVNQTTLPISGTGSSTAYFNDGSLSAPVMPQSFTSSMGLQTTVVPKSPTGPFDNLQPEKIQFTQSLEGPGVSPVVGLDENAQVSFAYSNPIKPGVPTQTSVPTGLGPVSWETPVNPEGSPRKVSVSGHGETKTLLDGALYDDRGRPTSVEKDEQGRAVTYQYADATGLGLLETMILSLPAEQVSDSALQTLTRTFSYDAYGRLMKIKDVETGAEESWTYDGLGRVLTHGRSGDPSEDWTYEYLEEDGKLTTRELLARHRSAEDPSPQHVRTSVTEDGLLTRESYTVGSDLMVPLFSLPTEPAFSRVSRNYGYKNGRLETMQDERGILRTYVYDANGRLDKVQVGLSGEVEVSYTYDNDGRVTSITDHLKRTTTIGYDARGRAVTWNYGDGDVEGVELDLQGTLMRTWWGVGRTYRTEVTRLDALGRPVETQSKGKPGGVLVTETRDSAGRLTKRVDGVLKLEDEYEYKDVLGRLTLHRRKVKTPDPFRLADKVLVSEETRAYDDTAHTVAITRVIDTGLTETPTRTESETWTLDTAGRVLRVERMLEGIGLSVDKYLYNERGQVRWHRSPMGAITEYWHDPMGNLVQSREPADLAPGQPLKTTYLLEKDGRPRLMVGPHPGRGVEYQYDDFGELYSKTIKAYESTPEARWTYERTGVPGVVKELGPYGTVTTRRFNARGRLVSETVSGTEGERTTEFVLEGPWETERSTREGTWKATWRTLERDDLGRPLDEVESWSAGDLGYSYQTKTAWTGRNATIQRIWTTTAASSTPSTSDTQRHRTMEVSIDSLGNVVRSTAVGSGYTDSALYDASGRPSSQQPAGRPATLFTYDQGLLRRTNYAGELTSYDYDLNGRLARRRDPDGRTQAYEYYPRGVVKSEQYGRLGDFEWEREFELTTYDYDSASGLLKAVHKGAESSDEQTWSYYHGARGELLSVGMPGGVGIFQYTYDALGRLKSVDATPRTEGMSRQEFTYDFANRLTERKRVGTADAVSWRTKYVDGVARTSPYPAQSDQDTVAETVQVMDGRGRVARTTYVGTASGSVNQDLFQVDYEYNGADQPLLISELRASNARMNNVFQYDARGLLTSLSRSSGGVWYEYTASGQRKSVRTGSSTSAPFLSYTYDNFDRLETLVPAKVDRQPTRVTWEPGGARLQRVGDDVVMQERCYDSAGRLSTVINVNEGAIIGLPPTCNRPFTNALMSYVYTYDRRGNRMTEQSGGSKVLSPGITRYGYDSADRLSGAHYSDGSAVLYSLGTDGTRLGEKLMANYGSGDSLDPEAFTRISDQDPNLSYHWVYEYNGHGGLQGIRDSATNTAVFNFVTNRFGQVQEQYDARANKSTWYDWDPAGRLARVRRLREISTGPLRKTDEYTFKYDYAGLRRQRTSNTGSVPGWWLYAGEELVAEFEVSADRSAELKKYERVGDLVTAFNDDRIMTDGLGSAVGRMSATGTTPYRYDAWGAYTKDSSVPAADKGSVGYTGHLWDDNARLVYAQQRWYSPQTGRFLSEDPVGAEAYLWTPTGIQPWLYANANPLRFIDLDGAKPGDTVEDFRRNLLAKNLEDRGMIADPSFSFAKLEATLAWQRAGAPLANLPTISERALAETREGVILWSKALITVTSFGLAGGAAGATEQIAARFGLGRFGSLALGVGLDAVEGAIFGVAADTAEQAVELAVGARDQVDSSQALRTGLYSAGGAAGTRLLFAKYLSAGSRYPPGGVSSSMCTLESCLQVGDDAFTALFGQLAPEPVLVTGRLPDVSRGTGRASPGPSLNPGGGTATMMAGQPNEPGWKWNDANPPRATSVTTQPTKTGEVYIEVEFRQGDELAGQIIGEFNPQTKDLFVGMIETYEGFKGRYLSSEMYKEMIKAAGGDVETITGNMAFSNAAAIKKYGDFRQTPRAKALDRIGYSIHSYAVPEPPGSPDHGKLVSKKPSQK